MPAGSEDEDHQLLAGFFEAYMCLSKDEREQVWHILEASYPREAERMGQITTPWHEMGRAEGLQEGRAVGLAEGHAEVLIVLLRERFGDMPSEVEAEIRSLSPDRALDLARAVFKISSLEQLRAWLEAQAHVIRES